MSHPLGTTTCPHSLNVPVTIYTTLGTNLILTHEPTLLIPSSGNWDNCGALSPHAALSRLGHLPSTGKVRFVLMAASHSVECPFPLAKCLQGVHIQAFLLTPTCTFWLPHAMLGCHVQCWLPHAVLGCTAESAKQLHMYSKPCPPVLLCSEQSSSCTASSPLCQSS